MANSAIVIIDVEGEEPAVQAAREHLVGYQPDENGAFRCESTWATRFDGIEEASAANASVAITAVAVELGNMNAEAKVWSAGDVIGEYQMPESELEELTGPDGEEEAVIDSLFATVAAYAHDALAASGPKA